MLHDIFPGLELYYTDPAQPLKTTGEELDDLDHGLSDMSDVWQNSAALSPLP